MKKISLISLALCMGLPIMADTPILAQGDSVLSFYGILDAGVATVSHSLNFDSNFPASVDPRANAHGNTSATGMFSGGISGSRLGIRGSADLGAGLKGVFNLESMINMPTGTLSNAAIDMATNRSVGANISADSAVSGQLFSRQAFVGISSDNLGTLTFGRHTAFGLDVIGGYDPLQAAQLFTPIGFAGSYGGGGATDNSRVDNSLKYRVKVANFNFGAMYKFGGVSGASTAQSATLFNVGYEQGSFGVQYIYQSFKDAFSVGNPADTVSTVNLMVDGVGSKVAVSTPYTSILAPLGTIGLTAYNTVSSMLTARYSVGPVNFKAGYEYMMFNNPSNPTQDGTITSLYGLPVNQMAVTVSGTGATAISALEQNVSVTAYSTGQKTLKVYWVGANWDITSKLNLGAAYYHVAQNDYSGAPAPAVAVSKNAGTSKFTSALLDYHFTRKFDLYVGYMQNTNAGGMAAGYLFDSNAITGAGVRYSF